MSRRSYDSSSRRTAAADTQARVVEVATRLMMERGYAATSVSDVAQQAQVSVALVYAAFGNKTGLLKRVLDASIAGDDEPRSIGERDAVAAVARARSARRRCELTAELVAVICGRTAHLSELLRDAASIDPEAAEMLAHADMGRRSGMLEFVDLLHGSGQLRGGLKPEGAADIAWVLTDPASYDRLLRQRGWAPATYIAWLSDALFDSLCRQR